MAQWNYDRFTREIEKSLSSPLYCVYGEETYLVEETVKSLVERGLDGAPSDFNVDVFYAGDVEIANVKDAIEMLPMMAPKRFVILKNSENLKAKDLDDLLSLVENPIDSTVFVMVADKIDLRKKIFKVFEKNGVLLKLERLAEHQLPAWVNKLAAREGKQISNDAVMSIVQLVGSSLLDINNEIKKLCQFIGVRNKIEDKDVREIVSHSRIESVFGLTAAIGERDRAKSLTFLAQLLDHGESEVGILALAARHIRILMAVKESLAQGMARPQIASRVGVPSFFLQNYIDQSQKWTDDKLESMLSVVLETDRALKSSPVSGAIWLENFILKACE